MGDTENSFPPTKKRAAGRELSRDNPGLDDEEEIPGQETGTFKRASDEVLANRRIVKVKRSQTSSTAPAPSSNPFAAIRLVPPTNSAPAPSSNPFAAIRLVPPTNSAPAFAPVNNSQEIEKPASETLVGNDENTPAVEKVCVENKDKLEGNDEDAPAAKKGNDGEKETLAGNVGTTPASQNENCGNDENALADETEKKESIVETDGNTPVEKEKDENKDKLEGNDGTTPASEKKNEGEKKNIVGNDEKAPVGESVNSFQQLSSSQNAFTGLVGTGFSSSTFSFGSIPKTDPPVFSSFSFGTNGSSSLFGSMDNKTEGTKTTPSVMQEVPVETGEENEKVVFTADSILFEFIDGGWKERGKGELKVNVLTSGTRKARLVMRARGNYRLILNASIFPDMKLTNMDKKGITFACLNSTGEGQNGLSTFALKFKDASVVEEFRSVVMAHKGNPSTGELNLKTPENSPKESEE